MVNHSYVREALPNIEVMNEANYQNRLSMDWYHLLPYQLTVLWCNWGSLKLDKYNKLADQGKGGPSHTSY